LTEAPVCGLAFWQFCGFNFSSIGGTDYSSVSCPGVVITNSTKTELTLPDSCPPVCTDLPDQKCFLDEACSDPYSPNYKGGLGCNAGGRGQNCRFCGFLAPGMLEVIPCPDPASVCSTVAVAVDELDLGLSSGTGQGSAMSCDLVTEVDVEVMGTVGVVEYGFVDTNTRCEDNGMVTITSVDECKAAAEAVADSSGTTYMAQDQDGIVNSASYFDRPFGCTWHQFGSVELWDVGSSTSKGCTHRGYAGCLCRKPLSIEASCSAATGAQCQVTNVAPAVCAATPLSGRRLAEAPPISKMTLRITQDVALQDRANIKRGAACLNNPLCIGPALQAGVRRQLGARGLQEMGEVRVNPDAATYKTVMSVVVPGDLSAADQEAITAAAGDVVDARVEGTSAALVGPAAQAAAADGNDGGDASPPPPCLTCAMGRGLGDGGLASWVVLVLVVSIGVVCLGIAGTVAYMRIRDRAKNAAKVPKVVAPEGERKTSFDKASLQVSKNI
jgi:hypothetical protein